LQAKRTGISLWDAFPFLALLGLTAITGFLVEGLRITEGFHIESQVAAAPAGREAKLGVLAQLGLRERLHMGPSRQDAELHRIAGGGAVFPAATAAPVGYGLAKVLAGLPLDFIRRGHRLLWWGHAWLALGLIVAIPYTKAFHVISSPTQLLLRHLATAGRLSVVAEAGVRTLRDCTWRQLLQMPAPGAASARTSVPRTWRGGDCRPAISSRASLPSCCGPLEWRMRARPACTARSSRPRSCGRAAPAGPAKTFVRSTSSLRG
jgi:hypothetical protein